MPMRKPNLDNPSLTFLSQGILNAARLTTAIIYHSNLKEESVLAQSLRVQCQSQQGNMNM